MADNATIFSLEAVAGGWFAPEVQGHGWFDRNQLDPPGAGGVDATASGATVSEVYSLIAGAASGQSNATASGATLTEAYSFIAGAAVGGSGAVDGTASGVTLTEAYSLVAGTVSGQSNATASGVTVTEAYSLLAGAASGGTASTANSVTVSYVYGFIPGLAAGEILEQQPAFTGGSYNFGKRRKRVDDDAEEEQDEKPLEVILIGDAPKRAIPKPEIIPIKRAKPKPAQTTNTLSRLQVKADQERAARIRRNIARSNAWLLTA